MEVARRWRHSAAQGGKRSSVVIGSTDRVLLSDKSRRRFESNFGLGSSGADAVRRGILQQCLLQDPGCSLRAKQVIVLASGTVLTLLPWSKLGMAACHVEDRRVDVWALWSS